MKTSCNLFSPMCLGLGLISVDPLSLSFAFFWPVFQHFVDQHEIDLRRRVLC